MCGMGGVLELMCGDSERFSKLSGIGFAFEDRTKPQRITVSPPFWRMGPMESVYVAISCDAFDPSAENTRDDSLTLKWCRLPESGRAAFFMIGRKVIPIEYNV
uniref:MSP domain-containing protein n=1 Tax=Globodera rostochiensis TaxID=31243 RepID=A0A914GZV1_GLORO